ncbi:MAG: hypothetical protein NUV67_04075 [archaeon]|nr:hypothetical protein [archaeon]
MALGVRKRVRAFFGGTKFRVPKRLAPKAQVLHWVEEFKKTPAGAEMVLDHKKVLGRDIHPEMKQIESRVRFSDYLFALKDFMEKNNASKEAIARVEDSIRAAEGK